MEATEKKRETLVEAVDFAVPTFYGIGDRFGSFKEAVAAARSTIVRFDYPGGATTYSRAFVQLRQVEPIQDRGGDRIRSGADGVLATWEVFGDGTIRGEPV